MVGRRHRRARRVAYVAYGAALHIHPLDGDNMIALSIADHATPRFLTDDFVTYVPGYRPLAYLTLWAQYQELGHGTVQLFAFNLLAAVAAALGAYAIVSIATGAGCSPCCRRRPCCSTTARSSRRSGSASASRRSPAPSAPPPSRSPSPPSTARSHGRGWQRSPC